MNDVYAFIEAEKTTHHVALLCRLLKVARSSFYVWMAGEQARAARRAADDALAHEITVLHIASRCTYGVPRIHAELRRLDRRVNRKRVERITRERDITGVTPAQAPVADPSGEEGGACSRPDRPRLHGRRPGAETGR
ncbi:IS3 family transposase [Streptomyces sp. NPDC060000]|uniref:IS3 family transposase n=1 Tax=Streptomyces sp. NPDC060000 TaxID=3347031 RepID=UPI003692EE94